MYNIVYYLFIHKCTTSHHAVKQCKRKFKKLGKYKELFFHKYTDNKSLKEFLTDFAKKHPNEPLGFICEDAKIIQNITLLPDVPNLESNTFPNTEQDSLPNVFCLHSNVTKIHYNSTIHNQYWNHIECEKSLNFVLNTSFVNKFINSIDADLDFDTIGRLFSYFATLFTKTVSVTQYNFTHEEDLYVALPESYYAKVCHNKQKLLDTYHRQLFTKNSNLGNLLPTIDTTPIQNTMANLDPDTTYKYTPKVTVIMTLTDINQFFVTFHSFLKQNYPRNKIELYILDEFKLDTKLKHLIPPESRIRFINMQTKENKKVPLGYKLNTGFKYAANDIVCVMLDTHYYNPNYIRGHVYQLLQSKQECNISKIHLLKDNQIHTQTSLDIGSLAATKKLWNNYSFQELENSPQTLLFDFIRYRHKMCVISPFNCISFTQPENTYDTIPTKLELDPIAKESIDVYNKCKRDTDDF